MRLARYPESNPDVFAQDVETIYKRMALLRRYGILETKEGYMEGAAPRLDAFPSPPSWRKRRRAGMGDGNRGYEALKARRVDKGRGSVDVQTPTLPGH
jgi:hypothetical protein